MRSKKSKKEVRMEAMSVQKKHSKNEDTFLYDLLVLDYYRDCLTEQDKKAVEFIPSENEIRVLAYDKFGISQESIDISFEYKTINKLALGRAIAILNGYKFTLTKPQADEVHFTYEEFNKILNKLF